VLWNILIWLLVGLIAGWLTGLVVKGSYLGLVGNLIMGLAGGFAGGILVYLLLDVQDATGINWIPVITAVLGAILFVWLLNWIIRGRTY
jgi:uncharacterized membrane protein YeaQ/YmgE (transglycosylase-associated protein family)